MAGDAELEAAGFRKHHVDARTLNIVHPQDTRQLGPFCRLDVATPLDVPLQPGVYAWVTDGEVRYIGHASVLRQIVNGTRMGRAYNDYTYVPPSKVQQTSSPRVLRQRATQRRLRPWRTGDLVVAGRTNRPRRETA